MNDDFAILLDGTLLTNVHDENDCNPPCPLHAPSDHHMLGWPLQWRSWRRSFERRCPHGVGHPDPDNLAYLTARGLDDGTHGCDGCCRKDHQ